MLLKEIVQEKSMEGIKCFNFHRLLVKKLVIRELTHLWYDRKRRGTEQLE